MLKAVLRRRTSMEAPVAAEVAILGRTLSVRIRELKVEMSEEVWR
jgi:hypothetical protein